MEHTLCKVVSLGCVGLWSGTLMRLKMRQIVVGNATEIPKLLSKLLTNALTQLRAGVTERTRCMLESALWHAVKNLASRLSVLRLSEDCDAHLDKFRGISR